MAPRRVGLDRISIPKRAELPGGGVGDGWVEIGPDDPDYDAWAEELKRTEEAA